MAGLFEATCRFKGLDFDVAASAGWYSATAGLLAGFAFVAVLLPLDHPERDEQDSATADAAAIFVSAFFSLLILSVSYAVLAGRIGDGEVQGIAAHEQMLAGSCFGLAVLLLIFGLHMVLGHDGASRQVFRRADQVVMNTTALLGPIVVLAQLFSNSLDLSRYRALSGGEGPSRCLSGIPVGVWVNLGITITAVVIVAVLAVFRNRLPRRGGSARLVAGIVLTATVVVVTWSALVLPLLPARSVTAAAFETGALAVASALVVAFAASAWASR
jgi:hypothetical protein